MAKCKSVRFAKKKYRSWLKVIIDFCDIFVFDFPSTYCWVGLKPFRHPTMEFFDKEVDFCLRAYRNLSLGYTCVDSVMGSFVDVARTTTPLIAFDERGITYLAA